MEQLESVEALIELENSSSELLFSSVNGMHIWPLIRRGIGLFSARKEVGSDVRASPWVRPNPAAQLSTLLRPNRFHSRRIRHSVDAMFLVGGATSVPTPRGRENWLVDYFAAGLNDATVIQNRAIDPKGDAAALPASSVTYSLDDAHLRVLVKSRLRPLREKARIQVRELVREMIAQYPISIDESLTIALEDKAVQHVTRAPHWRSEFDRILRRAKPKIVVMDLASYITRPSITQSIRNYGIPIAEVQHGWIGPSHAAYNFGKVFFEPELRQYLPDTLLTFGEYWSEGLRNPSEQVALGKPHLEKVVSQATASSASRNQVLLTSSVFHTEELVRLAISMRDALPPHISVAVRPHPQERSRIESEYGVLLSQDRIHIDVEPDVYLSFARSRAVIGYASTVLYEALPFDIPVFVIESQLADLYTPRVIFGDRISPDGSQKDVVELILSGETGKQGSHLSRRELERVWKPNAVQNFTRYLNTTVLAPR